jgi:hypothetical protein
MTKGIALATPVPETIREVRAAVPATPFVR